MRIILFLTMVLLGGCGADDQGLASQPAETTDSSLSATNPNVFHEQAEWKLMPEPMNWYDATYAPEGYRLPHRWELIKAFDEGTLGEINTAVWTMSDKDEWDAWRVVFSNMPGYLVSKSFLVDKRTYEYVMYKKVD